MSNAFAYPEKTYLKPERRAHVRQEVRALAYVELDEGNGGIVLNVGEGGLCVQAVASLTDALLPQMRFQLPGSDIWVETIARVIWMRESGKVAGLQFVDPSQEARGQIRGFLHLETPVRADSTAAKIESEAARRRERITDPSPVSKETISVPRAPEPAPPREVRGRVATPNSAGAQAAASTLAPRAANWPFFEERSTQDQTRNFKFTMIGEEIEPPAETNASRGPWRIFGLIAFLALVSLAAGWAAGEGTVRSAVERIRSLASFNFTIFRADQSPSTPPPVQISEIEVVNLKNQRWTIPLNGVSRAPQQGAHIPESDDSLQTADQTPPTAFNTPVLSPPVRSSGATDQNQDATALPEAPAIPQGGEAVPSIGSNSLVPQKELPVPKAAVPTGIVKLGELISRVDPIYPSVARDQRIEGTVKLNVTVGEDGTVRSITAVSGPQMLVEPATNAVRKWLYAPSLLDGKPIESHRDVSLVFHY